APEDAPAYPLNRGHSLIPNRCSAALALGPLMVAIMPRALCHRDILQVGDPFCARILSGEGMATTFTRGRRRAQRFGGAGDRGIRAARSADGGAPTSIS